MELSVIKAKKKILEGIVRETVTEFEKETGTFIQSINLGRSTEIGERHPVLYGVQAEVTIKP